MLFFSYDKPTPFGSKRGVRAPEGSRGVNTIAEKLPIEAFQGCAEHSASVEVNRGLSGAEAEAELVVEFLMATTESSHHGGVDMGGEFILEHQALPESSG